MKLAPEIKIVRHNRLFLKKYKYKIVVRTGAAWWFRGNKLDSVLEKLNQTAKSAGTTRVREVVYATKLYDQFKKMNDYVLRVEYPAISIYTNDSKTIQKIANIDIENVKYVSLPESNVPLTTSIVLKRLNYDYRVNIGKTNQDFISLIEWSKDNQKIRMTPRAIRELSKPKSWGGFYFYVKDEKSLLMVKMFIGAEIARIDNVIKV